MSLSKLRYHGKVTIRVKNKPPKSKHNEGTIHLFNLLNAILVQSLSSETGSTILNKSLPSYLQIIHNGSGYINSSKLAEGSFRAVEDYSILTGFLPIQNRSIDEDRNAKFTALLTHSRLNLSVKLEGTGYILLLDSSENEKILAFAQIDLDNLAAIHNDVTGQAAIDWVMSFDNSEEESN